MISTKDHSFSTFAKISQIDTHYTHAPTSACQNVRNASISKNFAYIINK